MSLSPTSTRPVILASIGPINPHQTTTEVESTSSIASAQLQSPWLLIGSVTAALVTAVVYFIILLAVIVAVCCIKGKKNKKEADLRRQSVLSDDEHCYDYVHTFGVTAQTLRYNYSKMCNMGGGNCHPTRTVETLKRNEAYDMVNRRSMDIEASQNIAYHSALDIL